MGFDFQKFRVVELTLNRGGEKTKDAIKRLKDLVNPIHSVSCVRHIFIFKDVEDQKALAEILEELKGKNKSCKLLTGLEAYNFLLSWIVGGEYRVAKPGSKLSLYNDNHVLGKFKKNWAYFLFNQRDNQLKRECTKVISPLLEEAHEIRKRIEQGIYGTDVKLRKTLDIVINNICFSKKNSLPVAYDHMHENRQKYVLSVMQLLHKRIRSISNTMQADEASRKENPTKTGYGKQMACANQLVLLKSNINTAVSEGLLKSSNKTNRQIHLFFKKEGLFCSDEFRKQSYKKACEESREGYRDYLSTQYTKTI
ncbi:Uncharacterised protein [Legionella steigerwaltii]|uniref:Uncharacterized protein n=1 Tax=Legionella steigerwaltii TaxID=460 RepID=A0A378LIC5_9GAMM|nr:hypothetical protein [Legionella steigerwaltii]KTD71693.1 hypothetical protein Lstg_2901 [Legionella steigerwaltii]STY23861.1 Uncharacterised protein [Legionella steigerwaltii]